MNSIVWPKGFVPGYTDNFASNEVIVRDLEFNKVWENLINTSSWEKYYSNMADIYFHNGELPYLKNDTKFRFNTFGFVVEAEVVELVLPICGEPGRVAWHGVCYDENNDKLDVHHAWLVEELPGNRVRILTQETQNGIPAVNLAKSKPNAMINGHQDCLDGLVSFSK